MDKEELFHAVRAAEMARLDHIALDEDLARQAKQKARLIEMHHEHIMAAIYVGIPTIGIVLLAICLLIAGIAGV